MNDAQNTEMNLNTNTFNAQKLLKFCYLILISVFLFSCGDKSSKQNSETDENVSVEADDTVKSITKKTILFFGDSITAGYGLDTTDDAFPALIQEKIDALQLNYTVINSGVSGETSSGGRNRMDWILNQDIDVFVLELGANDGLRGVPLSETRNNLQAIIDAVKQKKQSTDIILAGMELPPNMGQAYTSEFRTVFADLAEKNEVVFIPFILKDVGGIKALNQNDGIHPTAEGHEIIANTVWDYLKPLL